MEIKTVTQEDWAIWMRINPHAKEQAFYRHVLAGTGYILWACDIPVGVMHHCMLWDSLPFLNLLYIREKYRGQGFGTEAMAQWEMRMKAQGSRQALISTQVDEGAQHFYRKLGYADCGGLLMDSSDSRQPMEMFMRKAL